GGDRAGRRQASAGSLHRVRHSADNEHAQLGAVEDDGTGGQPCVASCEYARRGASRPLRLRDAPRPARQRRADHPDRHGPGTDAGRREVFVVEAGKPVQVVLSNPDAMPHNIVIGKPGSTKEIGTLATAMPPPSDMNARAYIPDSPLVLQGTKLVQR